MPKIFSKKEIFVLFGIISLNISSNKHRPSFSVVRRSAFLMAKTVEEILHPALLGRAESKMPCLGPLRACSVAPRHLPSPRLRRDRITQPPVVSLSLERMWPKGQG